MTWHELDSSYPMPFIAKFSKSETLSAQAGLVLHGFPSERIDVPSREKNHDMADYLSKGLGMDFYVPHYRGLGRSGGKFSFEATVKDSISLAQRLIEEFHYSKIHLVGHSWGGVVAMSVFKALGSRQGNMVLLSPFNLCPTEEEMVDVLRSIQGETPIAYVWPSIGEAAKDLLETMRNHNPRRIAESLERTADSSITIFQAIDDDEVPAETTRELRDRFKKTILYQEIHTDHRFHQNRDHVLRLICNSLVGTAQ